MSKPDISPDSGSYRSAAVSLARHLDISERTGLAAATLLVRYGHLPRCIGRHIVSADYDGLVRLTAAMVALECGIRAEATCRIVPILAAQLAKSLQYQEQPFAKLEIGMAEIVFRLPLMFQHVLLTIVADCSREVGDAG